MHDDGGRQSSEHAVGNSEKLPLQRTTIIMSSASSSRSASPAAPAKYKRAGKQKDNGPRNEGDDQNWAYQPPDGSVALDNPQNADTLDWDALEADEDLDIWLIRVPDSVSCLHIITRIH